jgi:hypothetical protein
MQLNSTKVKSMGVLRGLIVSLIPMARAIDSTFNILPPFSPSSSEEGCCSSFYDPVCELSSKGLTLSEVYPNECWAHLIGIKNVTECSPSYPSDSHEEEDKEHPRREGVICSKIYQPVCASNGETFPNECEAQAYNMEVVSQGECPLEPKDPGQDGLKVCPLIWAPVCSQEGYVIFYFFG